MPKILVLDAQMRNSLAIIRSLGKKGLEVDAGEETKFATGFFSKYCNNHIVYPSPTKSPEEFITYMLNLVKSNHYDVIFPVIDATTIPIVKHKTEFSKHTIVPFADHQTLTKASDKAQTLKIAMENGIPCPKTYFIDYYDDLEKIKDDVEYPVVVKPNRGFGTRGVFLCTSTDELFERGKYVLNEYGSFLVQEYIPKGDEIGVYALFDFDSKPAALSVQRRIRSYPISGGPSTLRETIRDEKIVDLAFRLLKAMKWFGVAMVEFRVDPRDSVPKLMEINPRFWGSLQLSILSGVDFPYLLYKLVTDGHIEPDMDYKTGVKCRWLLPGDMLWLFSAPNKLRNVKEFIKFNTNYDILSWDDPGPTFGFMMATARYMLDRKMWRFVIRKPMNDDKKRTNH
jgi:predicted ATP-grasp superfamily ATP-dependent carboligase